MRILLLTIACFGLVLSACQTKPQSPAELAQTDPGLRLSSYDDLRSVPMVERIKPINQFGLSRLRNFDKAPDYAAYQPSPEELKMFDEYYHLLPKVFRQVMEEKLVAIYWISNFKGGGMSSWVMDEQGKLLNVLYLNPEILHQDLSQWIAYRDNSSFKFDANLGAIKVEVTSEKKALLHTLCHESAHIYDYQKQATPYIETMFRKANSPPSSDFTQGVWQNINQPLPQYAVIAGPDFSVYGLGKTLDFARAESYYQSLANSPFSSIYGAQNWAEDFAESATWHYFEKRFGIHYSIRIIHAGKADFTVSPQSNPLVQRRHAVLDAIFQE